MILGLWHTRSLFHTKVLEIFLIFVASH